jgi:phospholipase/carboxylesterase
MSPLDVLKNVQHVTSGSAFETLGLVHRVKIPEGKPEQRHPTLVMIHGFQGNEDVTWIFGRAVPLEWLIITPRAPFKSPESGYSWNNFPDGRTDPNTFDQSVAVITKFINLLPTVYPVDPEHVILLGFSQGAGMAFAYAAHALTPIPVTTIEKENSTVPLPSEKDSVGTTIDPVKATIQPKGIAALSGYIPGPVKLPPLNHLPVFQFHGIKDETISIDLARKNRDQLRAANAELTYYEDEIGHKVSAGGMRALALWLSMQE